MALKRTTSNMLYNSKKRKSWSKGDRSMLAKQFKATRQAFSKMGTRHAGTTKKLMFHGDKHWPKG